MKAITVTEEQENKLNTHHPLCILDLEEDARGTTHAKELDDSDKIVLNEKNPT